MTSFKDARILPYEELPAIVTSSYLRFLITGLGQKEKKKKNEGADSKKTECDPC